MYNYKNKDWNLVLFPRIDVRKNPNVETFGLIEYKPKINEKISFYSRLQATYAHNIDQNEHLRSYIYLRSGISYNEFAFGLAANLDFYGPLKKNENSYGMFLNFLLF